MKSLESNAVTTVKRMSLKLNEVFTKMMLTNEHMGRKRNHARNFGCWEFDVKVGTCNFQHKLHKTMSLLKLNLDDLYTNLASIIKF